MMRSPFGKLCSCRLTCASFAVQQGCSCSTLLHSYMHALAPAPGSKRRHASSSFIQLQPAAPNLVQVLQHSLPFMWQSCNLGCSGCTAVPMQGC